MPASVFEVLDVRPIVVEGLGRDALLLPEHGLIFIDAAADVAEVASEDVPPMSHALPLTNVFRDDEVRPGLTAAEVLAAAPAVEDDRFRVPRILGEGA